jgi:50S ribosomal subunit-associated GTPase HflX
LEVEDRIESHGLAELILVDLPDLDSIAAAHKRIVESVLPVVDAVVWVFDPEKYADETIHTEFLAKLAPYDDQFVFVLNQVDRLSEATGIVAKDLGRMLEADGFREPAVVLTSAIDADSGAAELIEALSDRLDTKRTVVSKIATDLGVAANEGWMAACEAGSTRTDQTQVDESGLAAATFVSLGVTAGEVLSQLKEN